MAETLSFITIWTIGRVDAQVPVYASVTKNWTVHICEVAMTRNNINRVTKKLDPLKKWMVGNVSTDGMEKQFAEAHERGETDLMVLMRG